jgi:hypothetical protein
MMRRACPANPVWPRMQRRELHRKRVERIQRVCGWLWIAAKWSQKQGFYDSALAFMGQMTDYVEKS